MVKHVILVLVLCLSGVGSASAQCKNGLCLRPGQPVRNVAKVVVVAPAKVAKAAVKTTATVARGAVRGVAQVVAVPVRVAARTVRGVVQTRQEARSQNPVCGNVGPLRRWVGFRVAVHRVRTGK
jgi:hypothetical protein